MKVGSKKHACGVIPVLMTIFVFLAFACGHSQEESKLEKSAVRPTLCKVRDMASYDKIILNRITTVTINVYKTCLKWRQMTGNRCLPIKSKNSNWKWSTIGIYNCLDKFEWIARPNSNPPFLGH